MIHHRLQPSFRKFSSALLIGTLAHGASAQFDVAANGLPILNSNPGALSVAYMDFDGGNALGGTFRGPYGGDLIFDATEQQEIYNAWLDVSTHFAMFDINVTTVAPNKSVNPTSHVIISPDVSGGAANVNFHGNTGSQARGQNAASHARSRTTGITHEFGHILGLRHQSEFDSNGNEVKEYRGVDQWNRAPMMGVDFAGGHYAHWADGPDNQNTFFDEAQFIANKITSVNNNFVNGAYTGDGFRQDEHGNNFAGATPLVVQQTGVSGNDIVVGASANGIIERYTDIDMFSLNWTGGAFSLSGEAVRDVASAQNFASSVGLNLRVYDNGGTEIAQDLAVNPSDVNVGVNLDLAAGQYYFAFEGNGDAGDLGAYEIDFSGTTSDPTDFYDLIYRKGTGKLLIDTQDGQLINYVIEGPGGFIGQRHIVVLPFGTSASEEFAISGSSLVGNSGLLDIGQVLPAGLDEAAMQALIERATYVAQLGTPVSDFEIVYDERLPLFYDAATGELTIDTLDGRLINYVIEGSGFIEENHTLVLPFGSSGSEDFHLGESSVVGNEGLLSLGNVLPSGLTPAELQAAITRMTYVAALGTPVTDFDLGFIYMVGDLDLDVDVDDADFGIAFANFTGPGGTGMTSYDGDLDGDGDIDDADFGIAFANFTGPRGAPANVPEPASLALLVFGGLLASRRRG